MLTIILLVAALICFVLAAVGMRARAIDLVAAGLAFLTAAHLV